MRRFAGNIAWLFVRGHVAVNVNQADLAVKDIQRELGRIFDTRHVVLGGMREERIALASRVAANGCRILYFVNQGAVRSGEAAPHPHPHADPPRPGGHDLQPCGA